MNRLFLIVTACIIASSFTDAEGKQKREQKDPFKHPFANPVDQPGLSRVLIIGDSISIGYTPGVRRLLDGKANVHRPTTNCRWSAFGDEQIENWIGDSAWDVVHFNFGLWDWYGWSQDVKATPESYAASLESMVTKMKKTNAKLIFAVTTPPCIGPERKVEFVVTEERAGAFNDAARAVMKKHGVQVNDLYTVIGEDRAKYQRGENDVHYTEEGRDLLAAAVGKAIEAALPDRRKHAEAGQQPNIILVLVDDMGYSDLGAFGGEVRTPNIDDLARNGLRFTQNYNSARCCPSRASLLTGLYSHQAGIANFTGRDESSQKGPAYRRKLSKQAVTLAEVLREHGYSTYGVGKWHVGHEEDPIQRGFDEFYGYIQGHSTGQWNPNNYKRLPEGRKPEISYQHDAYYATDAFSDYAVEFVKQGQKQNKPFFLYLAHSSPHFPLQAPPETRDAYLDTYRRGWDVLREERFERQKKLGLVTDSWTFTERSDVPLHGKAKHGEMANGYSGQQNPAWETLNADRREDLAYRMATFAAMIEHVDRGIGRLTEHLKQTGDFENTLILFTSDNGACYEWGPYGFDTASGWGLNILHTGEHLDTIGGPGSYHSVGSGWSCLSNTPLRMYKHFNHEGGNCSPLIAHWPEGISKPDRWVRTPIHLMDIMPTICSVTGGAYPSRFNGREIIPVSGSSFAPVLSGANAMPERTLFFDHFESSAVRKGGWKLVRGNRRYKNRTWELYNIGNDRCETKNLIMAHPERAEAMENEWLDWAKRMKIAPYYKHVE